MGKHNETIEEKMARKVNYGNGDDDCWLWTAGVQSGGYAEVWWNGTSCYAYRVIYEHFNGPIPEGYDLDHECHNRAAARGECGGGKCIHRRCVRPDHVVAKPRLDNLRASSLTQASHNGGKTHCKRGHEFAESTTRRRANGYRSCMICERMTKDERATWDEGK